MLVGSARIVNGGRDTWWSHPGMGLPQEQFPDQGRVSAREETSEASLADLAERLPYDAPKRANG